MNTPTEKTTVYLDAADHRRLKALAAAENRPTAELIREAVAEYVRRRAPRVRPASIGAARSGQRDLAARSEELLRGFGEDE
jgi:predicted transcriptional regulator